MSHNGQAGTGHLPYYREYVDQILKPRVSRIIEEVRVSLAESVWHEVLGRIAREQGGATDPQALERLRGLLESELKLRMTTHLVADFDGQGYAPEAAAADQPDAVIVGSDRQAVDVIEQAFPANPLARAVGGVRRVNR